ncbi:hypothetical protein GOP47_0014228 [Adiantum capillus-veneris]|uniref:Uncharacterized protein n=1 Tax=Adiantum capillus-veneris TaxID=13818 RepID=A0A9D4ZFC3_ADICA|nr:hypothetical protein GOP47_0014228 [Adiantum capillus-veneris]
MQTLKLCKVFIAGVSQQLMNSSNVISLLLARTACFFLVQKCSCLFFLILNNLHKSSVCVDDCLLCKVKITAIHLMVAALLLCCNIPEFDCQILMSNDNKIR